MNRGRATILVLQDVLGHSTPEAAELLGIKVSTAQSRQHRARAELCGPRELFAGRSSSPPHADKKSQGGEQGQRT